jgi:hypothetical protein
MLWYLSQGVPRSMFVIESLNQKFELRGYSVYFDIKDSLIAEELLDSLDRATSTLKQVFDLTDDPRAEVYLYPDFQSIERVTQKPLAMGETSRLMLAEGALLYSVPNMQPPYGERVVREIGLLIFDSLVKERELGVLRFRTPAWLREGICMQASLRVRPDSREFLVSGWNLLQKYQKDNQLIRPNMLVKNPAFIPDVERRQLAFFQSFFMVRLLITTYCDAFFKKFSTLMGTFDDQEAETVFRQLTSFDFDKFFALFGDWVRTTNAWTAIE